MKKKYAVIAANTFLLASCFGTFATAADPSVTARAYDKAVDLQDDLESIDVTVRETTTVPGIKSNAGKLIHLKADGLKDLPELKVSISIETDDGAIEQYYSDGYFYSNDSGENIRYAMKPEDMLEKMNYYIYMDLHANSLASLEEEEGIYNFTATADTLGAYTDKLLEGVQNEHQLGLVNMQGYVTTNEQNSITRRCLQTVYTMKSGEEPVTCTMNTVCTFHNPGEAVEVTLPNLSSYKEPVAKKPVVEITSLDQTVYATDDLNVRAQNNVTAAVLGGIAAGSSIHQIGVTSDGWIQIDFNGTIAYVSGDFVSTIRPVIVKDMSGTMYATTSVYVRDKAGTEGTVLGVLNLGDAVEVSGYTNNNWIRVKYQGHIAYVTKDYLSWDVPVNAMGGTMYIINDQANVRSYYSMDSDVLGTLVYADEVKVTGYTSNNWIRVEYKGKTGYIYGDLISWTNPLDPFGQNHKTEEYTVNPEETSPSKQVYGTIVSGGMNVITLACTNGNTIQLYKDDAVINCPNGIYAGLYVSAVYSYDRSADMYFLEAMDAM